MSGAGARAPRETQSVQSPAALPPPGVRSARLNGRRSCPSSRLGCRHFGAAFRYARRTGASCGRARLSARQRPRLALVHARVLTRRHLVAAHGLRHAGAGAGDGHAGGELRSRPPQRAPLKAAQPTETPRAARCGGNQSSGGWDTRSWMWRGPHRARWGSVRGRAVGVTATGDALCCGRGNRPPAARASYMALHAHHRHVHRHPRAIFHTGARVGPSLRSRQRRAAPAGGRSHENVHGCIFIGGSLPATISPPPQNHIHISTTMIY